MPFYSGRCSILNTNEIKNLFDNAKDKLLQIDGSCFYCPSDSETFLVLYLAAALKGKESCAPSSDSLQLTED